MATARSSEDEVLKSFDERLHSSSRQTQGVPRADTLARTLTQALQSDDPAALNYVLQYGKADVVRKTVQQLPRTCIVPLLKELHRRILSHANSSAVMSQWMVAVLTIHTSSLTHPDLLQIMAEIHARMEWRTQTFMKLVNLQGRLNLILDKRKASEEEECSVLCNQPALQVYEDDSEEDQPQVIVLKTDSDTEWPENEECMDEIEELADAKSPTDGASEEKDSGAGEEIETFSSNDSDDDGA